MEKSDGLGISVGNAAQSKTGSPVIYTPPTPHSGARTPKTPRELDEFYARPGPNATSPTAHRGKHIDTSPTTGRFYASDPAMPRRMPPPPPPMLSAESSTEAAAPAPEPV
ncbi:MAG: hypothetical protein Q9183_002593, partial [Haloplaca sp. 2 TL-2023]